MALPVILVLTSKQCGHCVAMRGDGLLREPKRNSRGEALAPATIQGDNYWSPSFMRKLLSGPKGSGPARFRIYELNFPTMGARSIADAGELNEFELNGNTVRQITYRPSNGGVVRAVDGGSPTILDVGWGKFIQTQIPAEVPAFFHVWPSWLYVNSAIWDGAVSGMTALYPYIQAMQVKAVKGSDARMRYQIDTSSKHAGSFDPVAVAASIDNNSALLQPASVGAQFNVLQKPSQPVVATSVAPSDILVLPTAGAGCQQLGYRIAGLPSRKG